MGSKKADTSGDFAAARGAQDQYLNEIKKVSALAPSEEALKIKEFEDYQLQGLMSAEDYGKSAAEGIARDPRLQQAQMMALQELQTRGAQGMTAEEREQYRQFQEDASAQEMARQASLEQQSAQTGNTGAGLAAQIASSQASAQRQAEGGRQMGADLAAARRAALEQSANLAGGMSQQDIAQQQQLAQARDEFSKLNTGNRQNVSQYNLENRQRVGEQNTDLENQKRLQNVGAVQQSYQNKLAPLSNMGQAYGNMSDISLAQAQTRTGKKGYGQLIGTVAGATAGGVAGGPMGAGVGAQVGGMAGSQFADGGIVYHAQNGMSYADMQRQDRQRMPLAQESQQLSDNDKLEALSMAEGMTPLAEDRGGETVDLVPSEQLAAKQASADATSALAVDNTAMIGAVGNVGGALAGSMKQDEAGPKFSTPKMQAGGGSNDPGNILNQTKLQGTRFGRQGGLARFADGGFTYADGGLQHDGSGDIVPGESYAGDRVDAKLNSKEMVLNVEQQQRLLDTIKGLRKPEELPPQDIVVQANGAKAQLPEPDSDIEAKGLKKLIKMLGME